MNDNLNEILSVAKEFGQEYTEILITVGACFVVLMLVLLAKPKKKFEEKETEVPAEEAVQDKAAETAAVTEAVRLEENEEDDTIQVEKIELSDYEFEKEIDRVKTDIDEQLSMLEKIAECEAAEVPKDFMDNRAKLKVAVDNSNEQDNLMQQIGNMGMKVCGNSDRLESVEIKIEKAQIIFKYRDESGKAEISSVVEGQKECNQPDDETAIEEAPEQDENVKEDAADEKPDMKSDEIGQALKRQAELENRKFGAGNMNVSHSGRVFSEEELEQLIKE